MAHPRFAVVAGGLRPSSGPVPWPDADSAIATVPPGTAWFAWRLLGGNNRELGRSAKVYESADLCRAGAAAAREAASVLTATLTADVRRAMWRWRLDGGDGPVAVSSRLYLRQRECSYSLAQFLAGLAVASLWGDSVASAASVAVPPQSMDALVARDLAASDGPGNHLPALDVVVDLREPGPLPTGLTTRARQSAEWSRRRYVEARRTSTAQLRSR